MLNQKYRSDVVIATSTPNDYINSLANKYNLEVIVNRSEKHGIGYDFDFARTCVKTDLVTIAHQDDVYEQNYSYDVVEEYKKNPDAVILFTDYFELRYENSNENKRFFYQLDGEGIRYELVAFLKAIEKGVSYSYIDEETSIGICGVIDDFYKKIDFIEI